MRWSKTTLPAFALGLALLCGCTTTDNPIGISGGAQVDARLVGGWKGVFADQYSDKVKYQVVFLPGEKGALSAIVAGWTPEGGQWAVYEVVAGKAGDHTVLNMRSVIENGAPPETSPHTSRRCTALNRMVACACSCCRSRRSRTRSRADVLRAPWERVSWRRAGLPPTRNRWTHFLPRRLRRCSYNPTPHSSPSIDGGSPVDLKRL